MIKIEHFEPTNYLEVRPAGLILEDLLDWKRWKETASTAELDGVRAYLRVSAALADEFDTEQAAKFYADRAAELDITLGDG